MTYTAWLVGMIAPIIVAIVFLTLFAVFVKKRRRNEIIILGRIAVFYGIFATFLIAYTAWSGFGPGIPAGVSATIAGILAVIGLAFIRNPNNPEVEDGSHHPATLARTNDVVRVIIVCSLILPLFGAYAFLGACDALHQRIGAAIIPALEAYKQATGKYPEKLDVLVPGYTKSLPSAICLKPYKWILGLVFPHQANSSLEPSFSLLKCDETLLLTVPATVLGYTQRYNLSTGQWSTVDFLDGECSYLN